MLDGLARRPAALFQARDRSFSPLRHDETFQYPTLLVLGKSAQRSSLEVKRAI
jgi:hypothetical protein